ncbi:tRNA lysidine(34) synthetase TilS [Falsiroseomonas bella]|uniref:tRNA(Ile)-lysidine synthase n=1 Tax=Falsiroseomonas bella TaxID=2184016 RepID=A0A317FCX2_9PROT|nr:tRNA lysidine(34) synthetase TilS [Falsiroseomonas bella]PWS36725.1 tRNA lysidine(34) synthetase TilS [Falsiroseomonas bella]
MRAAAPPAASRIGPGPAAEAAEPVTKGEFDALMAPLGPFGPTPVMLAGVSGGPHSLALALLTDAWARARGGRLLALVCDHGLRPESGEEAAGVAAMLARRGIAARVESLGLTPGAGAQERARAARLRALLRACRAQGAPWLLLGHHRHDQAETLLMRALAGSGPAGLAAMATVRAEAEALVLRPLLGVAPARLEAVVAEAGLEPVRDPSNRDARFTRIRLRGGLGEGAVSVLAETAARFGQRRRRMAAQVAGRLAGAAMLHDAGFARLDLPALGSDPVARAALSALVRVVAGAAYPPPEAAVGRLLAQGEGTLAGVVLRRGGLLLREAAALGPPVEARAGALWDGRFRLVGAPPPGAMIGAAGEAARRLKRPGWMPAGVVPTLPALYVNGTLAEVPALAYRIASCRADSAFRFAPAGGAMT